MRTSRIVVITVREISWGASEGASIGEATSSEVELFTFRTMWFSFLPEGIDKYVKASVAHLQGTEMRYQDRGTRYSLLYIACQIENDGVSMRYVVWFDQ